MEEQDSPTNAHEVPATKAERVAVVVDLMRGLEWQRGKTGKLLAGLWGLSESTIKDYAAEASRIVCAEITDPTEVRQTVCASLDIVLRRAVADDDRKSVIGAAREWATISGAKAAERHEVAGAVAGTPADAQRVMRNIFGAVTPATAGQVDVKDDAAEPEQAGETDDSGA